MSMEANALLHFMQNQLLWLVFCCGANPEGVLRPLLGAHVKGWVDCWQAMLNCVFLLEAC